MAGEEKKIRHTTLRKSITRKINTGNYSNVDISVQVEQEVDWVEISELMKKSENLTKLVFIDFAKTQESVLVDMFDGPTKDRLMKDNNPSGSDDSF